MAPAAPRVYRARQPVQVIAADPGWRFKDKLPGGRGAASQYRRTMPLDKIKAFPLERAVGRIADDAWLFLWYVIAMAPEGAPYDVARAWGFEPTGAELTWIKTTGPGGLVVNPDQPLRSAGGGIVRLAFGMGRATRACTERCLIARRGRPVRATASLRDVFFAPQPRKPDGRIWHSAKPPEFFDLVDELVGPKATPRVELFARTHRPGWIGYGDELPAVHG